MRIIAGDWKGRRLKTVKGMKTRPTADKVKGAIFSILGERVIDAAVLDLFAGTGNLSFEALSRGAARAVLTEKNHEAFAVIKENIARLGACNAHVYQIDAFNYLQQNHDELYDLIFLDPPYHQELVNKALTYIKEKPILSPRGVIIAETAADENMSEERIKPFDIRIMREYGDTKIWFIQENRE